MPARHYVTTILLALVLALAWLLDSRPSRSQGSAEALTTTLSDADQAALRTARHVADKLLSLNAGGLKSAASDPDLKQSIGELQQYVKTVGTTYVRAQQVGLDPQSAMVIAGVAGELTPYKADYDALLKAARDRSWAEARDFAAQKLGEKMSEKLTEATLKSTTGAILRRVPAGVMDTAKVGARFMMAYEAGVIDTALPQGLRPALERNPTSRAWLNQVTAALQSAQADQPAPNNSSDAAHTTAKAPLGTSTPTGVHANASASNPSSKSQTTATPRAIGTPVIVGTAAPVGAPGALPKPTTTAATNIPVAPSAPIAPRNSYTGLQPAPGGVSLSRAAADRMPLEIALDASTLSDGKIVLSGRTSKTQMDAALFLTALRASCDDRDPYFSLDPDNGALWSEQGDKASNEFWEKIKKDFLSDAPARAKNAQPGITVRTVSATQDYSEIWRGIAPHYPNFRSKLVFYPEWLRQTRLGEVLYKADVLLKELSSGVSILVPGKLRASEIPGYLSADIEYAANNLVTGNRDAAARPQWHGSRLWFDISPSELPISILNEASAPPSLHDPALRSLLQSKGLIRSPDKSVQNASFFIRDGDVFDLSQVNPIMFVRVHDQATNKDLSDHDPRLDGLAADVSTRFARYAENYDELRLLRDVSRAYIAARKLTDANERLCASLDAMPLLESERVSARLPDYHPSELFVTIAHYWTTSRQDDKTQSVRASSMSGGVSIAGQKFVELAMRDGETTITRAVKAALAGVNLHQADTIDFDRKFISFIVNDDSGAPVRLVSNALDPSTRRSLSDYSIENEPVARTNPFVRQDGQGRSGADWDKSSIGVFLALLALGLLVNYVAFRRRIVR
ncbi:hypothetical protein [Bradyrhizobium japonicum]|uniref:hypothetical protein n=1 Tax=Bradyrhizobium japonicum TaxID=375 RepID=UPI0004AE082D|nr:hypothetical protein [Bradyrhizobium japonicum]